MSKRSFSFVILLIALELLAGILGIIAILSVFLIVVRQYLGAFDKTIISWVYTFRSEILTEIMKGLTFLGGEIFITCGILVLLAIIYKKHKITTFNFSILLFFGVILNLLLKILYHRPRPEYLPLAFEPTYSFPSGHAMNSFIFYVCLAYFIHRNTKKRIVRILALLCFSMLVLLIGISRIYLGVHYPSDVLAGYIAGLLWFGVVILVEKTAHRYDFFKRVL